AEVGLGNSYPTARMATEYLPGASLSRGKLYWPSALLTTVMVIVEPARFALTSTPSITPSSCEVTLPASADGDGVWAIAGPASSSSPANTAPVRTDERIPRISLLILNPPAAPADLPEGPRSRTPE